MRILLSNDDGYLAKGLIELYKALKNIAHVQVIAPMHNHSGASNALTLQRPLHVHHLDDGITQGFYIVDGTPTDCVHLALTGLLNYKPDLVVSGINQGANLAEDVIYSGTVAAAIEGHLFGIPSVAFSHNTRNWPHVEDIAKIAVDWVMIMQKKQLTGLWNVNIPATNYIDHQGFKMTRLGKRHASQPMIEKSNPRGEKVYWIGAAGEPKDQSNDTDFYAVQQNYSSVTPLQLDFTNHKMLDTVII